LGMDVVPVLFRVLWLEKQPELVQLPLTQAANELAGILAVHPDGSDGRLSRQVTVRKAPERPRYQVTVRTGGCEPLGVGSGLGVDLTGVVIPLARILLLLATKTLCDVADYQNNHQDDAVDDPHDEDCRGKRKRGFREPSEGIPRVRKHALTLFRLRAAEKSRISFERESCAVCFLTIGVRILLGTRA